MTAKKSKENRITICVFRGLPSYKEELRKKLANINNKKASMDLTTLIEEGINLALVQYGEKPISGRLQGRYSKNV